MKDSKLPEPRAEQEHQQRGAASQEKSGLSSSKPPKWYERTRYQVLLFAAGIAIFGLVLGFILDWYIDPQTSTQKKDLVQALGLITAGVAGAVGIFFTWRGQRITQESLQDTRENSEENLRLTRQGQITERFTRAIDQLGSDKLEVRLGGIYALERIARDSPERDYSTIMQVLTAYVRENPPQAPGPSNRSSGAASLSNEATVEADEGTKLPAPPEPRRPTADIQAILVVLRRAQARIPEKYRARLDLHEANLRGASLQETHLNGAVLIGANFQGAHLNGAVLQGAYLQGAILQEAYLQRADLQDANLYGAYLQRADLRGAILQRADLHGAILQGAYLQGADLRGAHLQGADLQRAHLRGANLQGANLQGAYLQGASLLGANLQGAELQDANLYGVNGITEDQIEWALGSSGTKLGEDLNHPELWSKSLEEQATIISEHMEIVEANGRSATAFQNHP